MMNSNDLVMGQWTRTLRAEQCDGDGREFQFLADLLRADVLNEFV